MLWCCLSLTTPGSFLAFLPRSLFIPTLSTWFCKYSQAQEAAAWLLSPCPTATCSFSVKHSLGSCHRGPVFVVTKRGHTSVSQTALNVSCPLAPHAVIDGARTNLLHKPGLSSLAVNTAQGDGSPAALLHCSRERHYLQRRMLKEISSSN